MWLSSEERTRSRTIRTSFYMLQMVMMRSPVSLARKNMIICMVYDMTHEKHGAAALSLFASSRPKAFTAWTTGRGDTSICRVEETTAAHRWSRSPVRQKKDRIFVRYYALSKLCMLCCSGGAVRGDWSSQTRGKGRKAHEVRARLHLTCNKNSTRILRWW